MTSMVPKKKDGRGRPRKTPKLESSTITPLPNPSCFSDKPISTHFKNESKNDFQSNHKSNSILSQASSSSFTTTTTPMYHPSYFTLNPKSPLIYTDVCSLFSMDLWNVFSKEEQAFLLTFLPECDINVQKEKKINNTTFTTSTSESSFTLTSTQITENTTLVTSHSNTQALSFIDPVIKQKDSYPENPSTTKSIFNIRIQNETEDESIVDVDSMDIIESKNKENCGKEEINMRSPSKLSLESISQFKESKDSTSPPHELVDIQLDGSSLSNESIPSSLSSSSSMSLSININPSLPIPTSTTSPSPNPTSLTISIHPSSSSSLPTTSLPTTPTKSPYLIASTPLSPAVSPSPSSSFLSSIPLSTPSSPSQLQHASTLLQTHASIKPYLFNHNMFRQCILLYQDYLTTGRLKDVLTSCDFSPKLPMAQVPFMRRRLQLSYPNNQGENKDEEDNFWDEDEDWKDANFESFWGELAEKQKRQGGSSNPAGTSSQVKLHDLFKKGMVKPKDVLVYEKYFDVLQRTLVEKFKIEKLDSSTGLLHTYHLPSNDFYKFTGLNHMETFVFRMHATEGLRKPNGNAWRNTSRLRSGCSPVTMFFLRKEYVRLYMEDDQEEEEEEERTDSDLSIEESEEEGL